MIPASLPQPLRAQLLDPEIVVAPLLWLASAESDGVTGRRIDAARWRGEVSGMEAARTAMSDAAWPGQAV